MTETPCTERTPVVTQPFAGYHADCPCTRSGPHSWHACSHNLAWHIATADERHQLAQYFNPNPELTGSGQRISWLGSEAE